MWGEKYDGNKVVFMTDHLYTPAGIRNGSGSAKYKGADAAVVQLLDLAIEKGVDIDYDHGTVSFSESGTGESDGYYGRWGGDSSYYWGETIDSDLSLDLSTWGSSSISEEEMIPEDYFEDQEPKDESFEATGNAGVEAERQYEDAEAIVIWPRSQRWKIVTQNDTSKMCQYLLEACKEGTTNSEPREQCIEKAIIILPRVKDNNTASIVSTLMKCIVMIGDVQLMKKFLIGYLSMNPKKTPDHLIDQLQAFIDKFGAEVVNPFFIPSINVTRFYSDPTSTAKFLVNYINTHGEKATNAELTENLISAFVDSMCPPEGDPRPEISKNIDSFPLKEILGILIGGKHSNRMTLAKRVLKGYVWLSCQHIRERYSYYSSSCRTVPPKGPKLLLISAPLLVSLCEKNCWADFEELLVEATSKLCLYGSSDDAVALVEKIAPTISSSESERSRTCAKIASITCEEILANSQKSPKSLDTYKKIVKIISTHCPSFAPKFTSSAKQLDVSSILYHLVTNNALRAAACDSMKESLGLLTHHCAQVLSSRVTNELGSVTLWDMKHANLSQRVEYSSFLRDPCRQIHDWQVRKSDHKGFLLDLRRLISMGEVKAESYQPGGRGNYHFKITKLKSRRVPIANIGSFSCSCSVGSRYTSYHQSRQQYSNCLLKNSKTKLSKCQSDREKLRVVNALLKPEQQSQPGSRKRSANPYSASASMNNATRNQRTSVSFFATNPSSATSASAGSSNLHFSSFASASSRTGPNFLSISSAGGQWQRSPRHQASKKQKTSPEVVDLLDDDDDVQIGEVLGPEQAIAKRVKEAEDKGEVVDIS
mmetsp:Transcript_14252/g.30354  ORF Transcript_14252/g.30354 Transcript_14252/m.30354 type:complete len:821 (+) Transcript_14252:234-2696(+)